MNTRFRSFRFETLEERLALSTVPFPVGEAFASAAGIAEAEDAFVGSPMPTAAAGEYNVGTCHDVNQNGSGDSLRSFAAAAANVIAYTNWGYSVAAPGVAPDDPLFRGDDEIYAYIADRLAESGVISGLISRPSGFKQSLSSALNQGIAELYPGFSGRDISGRPIWNITDADASAMGETANLLRQGYGVMAGIGLYLGKTPEIPIGASAVTVWGYTYNANLSPSNPAYYTGLIVSDSADGRTGTATCSIEWNAAYQKYRLTGYSGMSAWLEILITLKPVAPLTEVSLRGYDGPYDGQTHTVTVAGPGNAGSDNYTVSYFCGGIQLEAPPSFRQPGSNTVQTVVIKNNYEAIWSAPVVINIAQPDPAALAVPKIRSAASAGRNSHSVIWNSVAGASGYEIAWSVDGGVSWSGKSTENSEYRIKKLPYGAEVLYRVRALGDGISTKTSSWSETKRLRVNPSDIDGDGFIGPGDFALLSAAWFASDGDGNYDPRPDVDGDGFAGPGDFTYLSANWFKDSDSEDSFYPPV